LFAIYHTQAINIIKDTLSPAAAAISTSNIEHHEHQHIEHTISASHTPSAHRTPPSSPAH